MADSTYSRVSMQLLVTNSNLVRQTIAPKPEDIAYFIRAVYSFFALFVFFGKILYFVDTRFNFIVDQIIILMKVFIWAMMPHKVMTT